MNRSRWSQGSSVNIVTRLWAGQLRNGGSVLYSIHTISGAHSGSCPLGTEDFFAKVKLTCYLRLVPRINICGAISPCAINVWCFYVWDGKSHLYHKSSTQSCADSVVCTRSCTNTLYALIVACCY